RLHDRFAQYLLRRERLAAPRVFVHEARQQILIEAAPVHADADGFAVPACGLDHFRELRVALAAATHIPRADAVFGQRLRTRRVFSQQLVSVEVELAYERHVHAELHESVAHRRDCGGGFPRVHGDADQLGARPRERSGLLGRALGVRRVRVRHGLHDDGRVAADANGGDVDGDRLTAGGDHREAAILAHDPRRYRSAARVDCQAVSSHLPSRFTYTSVYTALNSMGLPRSSARMRTVPLTIPALPASRGRN